MTVPVLVCLLITCTHGSVAAQSKPKNGPPREAVDLYHEGRALYQEGRYREAITRLKAALELDPDSPNLMYNVARVNELLGNLDEAIEYYKRYLYTLPASEINERAELQATLQRLAGARAQVQAFASQHPSELKDLRSQPYEPLGNADTVFWLTAGVGAALLIGGGITGWMALQRENDFAEFVVGPGGDGPRSARQDLADEADALALSADIMLGAGLAAAVGATLLFFVREPSADANPNTKPSVQLGPALGRGRAGIVLSGAF